ncbi:MAG: class I SAM-dependent methyltransferase [Anaerolineae bacterium]|nr:class I SAM-dependent methyltransferase [Anaerolineae bacterium]
MESTHRSPVQDRRLRFWNDIVYNLMAPVYNSLDWLTFGAWWRLVRRALDYVPAGVNVLEVAFGPGKLHEALARRAGSLAGIDLAKGMCRYTHRRIERAGLRSLIARASVYEMPYPDGEFDTVVSTFAFSGFPDGPAAMAEMIRVVRPGGRIVIVDIGLPRDGNRAGTFWARLWERFGDFLYDVPAIMESGGLTVTTFEEYGPGNHIRAVVGEKPG